MKKLIILLAMALVLFSITASAGDKKDVKYELKATIVYNAVDADRLARIVAEIATKYGDACKVSFNVIKVGPPQLFVSDGEIISGTILHSGGMEAN